MDKDIILNFTKDEFIYLKELIISFNNIKIPKGLRTEKSQILNKLCDKFSKNIV